MYTVAIARRQSFFHKPLLGHFQGHVTSLPQNNKMHHFNSQLAKMYPAKIASYLTIPDELEAVLTLIGKVSVRPFQ